MPPIIQVDQLSKQFPNGFEALKSVDLTIDKGEIFALLGPNGAGKTTLISIICGLVNPSAGRVSVAGADIIQDYRKTRQLIGLVPQEIALDIFSTVWATVTFSRGLFGRPADPKRLEDILKSLTLWDKRNEKIIALSGGMKRRVMIAKALAHDPEVLFLDEPTAGVDVELRRDMWELVRKLRQSGVTIILTTHYIEEAEEMADRIGVIRKGELILVEEKSELMQRLGKKRMSFELAEPLTAVPAALKDHALELAEGGRELVFTYGTHGERTGVNRLLADLGAAGVKFRDIGTRQSSLEDIFVDLVEDRT